MRCPTPARHLVDRRGRPYFLWDCDLTLDELRERLDDSDIEVRAYFIGKLMRQAKPDDVLTLVSASTMRALWPRLARYLGQSREFWTWLLALWEDRARATR